MKHTRGDKISGWLVVDKPAGMGSTQVVGQVRHLLNAAKAGHCGTLDPFATGVLPIAVGEATKLVPYVQVLEKDSNYFTRGFFVVSGTLAEEHVTVVVNHLPSRYSEEFYRKLGAKQLRVVVDSLLKDDPKLKLIVMGDMNDDPMDESMAIDLGAKRYPWEVKQKHDLYNPFWNTLVEGHGTLEYMGRWNLFDQIIAFWMHAGSI